MLYINQYRQLKHKVANELSDLLEANSVQELKNIPQLIANSTNSDQVNLKSLWSQFAYLYNRNLNDQMTIRKWCIRQIKCVGESKRLSEMTIKEK